MRKHTPGMFLTDFCTQKYTGGIISQVGIFLTVTQGMESTLGMFFQCAMHIIYEKYIVAYIHSVTKKLKCTVYPQNC